MKFVAAENRTDAWTVHAPGRVFSLDETASIVTFVRSFPDRPRSRLAREICETFNWRRPSGVPKVRECWEMLWRLQDLGAFALAPTRTGRRRGQRTRIARTPLGEPRAILTCPLADLLPLELQLVGKAEHALWSELIDRHHYLGFATPFGAHLRYLIRSRHGDTLACLQFSSAAWRLAPRDRWIGWSDRGRARNLSHVIQQSRFLILPWVCVPHLASHILSRAQRALRHHWPERYSYTPRVLETLVDPKFTATSYRAANWIYVGDTSGRGRMDRECRRFGVAVKRVFVIALDRHARRDLCRQ